MEENDQVELELSVARRWLLDGNIKRAWLHLGLAKYYHLQEDKAAEHRVQPTPPESPRVPFFCKNCNSWHYEKCLNDMASG